MNAIAEPRIAAISVIRLTRADGADAATALTPTRLLGRWVRLALGARELARRAEDLPGPRDVPRIHDHGVAGEQRQEVLVLGVVGGDHHSIRAVERLLQRLRPLRDVRIVARDVSQLALEQPDDLGR